MIKKLTGLLLLLAVSVFGQTTVPAVQDFSFLELKPYVMHGYVQGGRTGYRQDNGTIGVGVQRVVSTDSIVPQRWKIESTRWISYGKYQVHIKGFNINSPTNGNTTEYLDTVDVMKGDGAKGFYIPDRVRSVNSGNPGSVDSTWIFWPDLKSTLMDGTWAEWAFTFYAPIAVDSIGRMIIRLDSEPGDTVNVSQ